MEGIKGFCGHRTISLDDKFRVRIPTCYREHLGKNFVLSKGAGGCILVLSETEFEKIAQAFRSIPMSDLEGRKKSRKFFAGVEIPEEDKQGRFVVSSRLRAYADIDKKIEFVGNGDVLEMWGGYYDGETEEESDMPENEIESVNDMFSGMNKYGL